MGNGKMKMATSISGFGSTHLAQVSCPHHSWLPYHWMCDPEKYKVGMQSYRVTLIPNFM